MPTHSIPAAIEWRLKRTERQRQTSIIQCKKSQRNASFLNALLSLAAAHPPPTISSDEFSFADARITLARLPQQVSPRYILRVERLLALRCLHAATLQLYYHSCCLCWARWPGR